MKRILVPTNFSSQAGWAIEAACQLAFNAKAQVILLHVVEYPANESYDAEPDHLKNASKDAIGEMIWRNKMYLGELANNLMAIGVPVAQVVRYGNLFHAIRATIVGCDVDLVVMGTAKRTRIEEVMDGSRTEEVVRFSETPVLTLHEKPQRGRFGNIVFATSLNENRTRLPELLTAAEKLYGAKVHIATVNTPKISKADSDLKTAMELFARKNGLQNYTLNVINGSSEEAGIIEFAKRISADLIVLATHGRPQFTHELCGNIPQDVVNHSGIPVLTYRFTA